MRIRPRLLFISGIFAGATIATTYCLLTKDARRKVLTAGKKTISSTKRVLSALDASGIEDHSINLDEHRENIDRQCRMHLKLKELFLLKRWSFSLP